MIELDVALPPRAGWMRQAVVSGLILISASLQDCSSPKAMPIDSAVPDIRQAELAMIRADLDEYQDLSTATKNEFASAIAEVSQADTLPPGLLHAICQIESDYRFNVDHPVVTIKIGGKYQTVHARGVAGIIWEIWGKKLHTAGIAETSSDLYIPRIAIRSLGFILRVITNDEISKGNGTLIVRRIIAQYYGVVSPEYERKMKEVTSNLWLKRIARQLEEGRAGADSLHK